MEYELIAAGWSNPILEPYTTTAALASVTSRIRLLVAIHAGLIQPQVVAKFGANIDQISGGRFHVNLVSGEDNQQFDQVMYGGVSLPHDARYARSAEFVTALRGMWCNEAFSYRGEYYQLENVTLTPKPVQRPSPTIFVSGSSEVAKDLTAKFADWCFINGLDLAGTCERRSEMIARASEYGRELKFAVSATMMIRDTDREAQKEIDYLNELAKSDRIVSHHTPGLRAGLWGAPDRIVEQLYQYSRSGIDMMLLQARSMADEIRRFGEALVPMLPDWSGGSLSDGSDRYLTI
jgi:FMNH2-dependent dimethyl sulfone monooxygenase